MLDWKTDIRAACNEEMARMAREHADFLNKEIADIAESPIEALMLAALVRRFGACNPMSGEASLLCPRLSYKTAEDIETIVAVYDMMASEKAKSFYKLIMPQLVVESYRVDIVVFVRALDSDSNCLSCLKIAIECDGHNYHERTKKQAQRDRSRDRRLQALGFKVFRFTGSEIVADAVACALEVDSSIESWIGERLVAIASRDNAEEPETAEVE